jgi:hypothetical protein
MLKDWDAFERLPQIDQMLLLEGLMTAAIVMGRLGEWWIAERIVADPRCRQWAFGEDINLRMNGKPRLGYEAVITAIAEHTAQEHCYGN